MTEYTKPKWYAARELIEENNNLRRHRDDLQQQLLAEQAYSERLRSEIAIAAEQIRRCDYTPARSALLVALDTANDHTALREHEARLLEEAAAHFRKTWRPMHDWDRHVETELRRMAEERRNGK